MAHFLRGKQAGVQNDFSSDVTPDAFVLDDLRRFGVSSQISQITYDPVQSLLAVGTKESQYGAGQIYVFGQGRVAATFQLQRKASIKLLQFCSDRLVCLDSRNDISIFSLVSKTVLVAYSPPGMVSTIASDPTLDYIIIGLQNGDILAYDMDRQALAPFKLPCFWKDFQPKTSLAPIVSLQFHPRDIGKLLIGYAEGAAIYTFKQNTVQHFFQYHVPRGAPGGDANPTKMNVDRNPKLTQAVWHPTGTFILTLHDDSSLVFWDSKDGRMLLARSLTNAHVEQPGRAWQSEGQKSPWFNVAWCANQDPDDTGVLLAGGLPTQDATRGMTFLELGRTPNYATATWQHLTDYFENPKRQRLLATPPGVEVVDFCLIPRQSPWFAGAQDPIAIVALLSSGEVTTLSFPSGYPISPTNQLHVSLTFAAPFVTRLSHAQVDRTRWLGLKETRSSGPSILRGGAEATYPMKRFESRSVIQTAHADGSIRIWDVGHGDEIENPTVIQADVSRAVGRMENLQVTQMSLASSSGEFAAALRSGEVVIFRWSRNVNSGREPSPGGSNKPKVLTDVSDRKDPTLQEGFHPFTLLNQQDGPATALKASEVGFIAAGFEGGSIVVIDMRGPAIILNENINHFFHGQKSGLMRRKSQPSPKGSYPTVLEFSVMTADDDPYSSILLHAGCNTGQVVTFKVLPKPNGTYTVEPAGVATLDDQIINIIPINSTTGRPAYASGQAVANLRNSVKVDGVILTVTRREARIFRPCSHKGAGRSWDSNFCDAAGLTHCHSRGFALVGLFGDGTVRSYTIPGLREIGAIRLDKTLDVKRFSESAITASGEIVAWTGPSEVALMNVWGTGEQLTSTADKLFNPEIMIPPRPTISNFQWVSGSQYVTPSDIDLLVGGPNRPPSKRMLAQARADEAAQRSAPRAAGQQEGYWQYMTRQLNERTEKLNIMGDQMDALEENSSGWADEVNKFVSQQKRNIFMGAAKSKFGL